MNLSTVSGTGNFGRVTEADVLAFLGEAPKGGGGGAAGADAGLAMREAPDLPDGPKVCARACAWFRAGDDDCGGCSWLWGWWLLLTVPLTVPLKTRCCCCCGCDACCWLWCYIGVVGGGGGGRW